MKPTLVILAAGLSSRYKIGLKQIDPFGPSGEILLDYAIYDAIKAGFGKTIFVIQKNRREDFKKLISDRYQNKIEYDFAVQELDDLPDGRLVPADRRKPWGTGHALWAARKVVDEPFAVINADDFYGSESFITMARFLSGSVEEGRYAMIGYPLENTLSDFGGVSRGICEVTDGMLQNIIERTVIKQNQSLIFTDMDGCKNNLDAQTIVSMNFWGFRPRLFSTFERTFCDFLSHNIENPQAEFYLPEWINGQIKNNTAVVEVLKTSAQWIGVTYPQDKPFVINKLKSITNNGEYPKKLF